MRIFSLPMIISGERTSRWTLLGVVIVGLGISGYLLVVGEIWKPSFEIFPKLPAGIFTPIAEEKEPEEELVTEEMVREFLEAREVEKYLEIAGEGEGITHLARKVLKEYLKENPQDFKATPEHKIYIEDYIVKKTGSGWLELGQEVEFSVELIEEAIERSTELSSEQLDNLTQYSQLVSF